MRNLTVRQGSALALCGLVAAIDGFDTQAVGFTGPLIARDIGFAPANLGWLFSFGLLGAAFGAFAFGPLADRFGRKPMLVLSCFVVGVFTGLTLFAETLPQVLACRTATGIGLGGATPCFIGIAAEAVDERFRRPITAMLYACFPAGGVIGALLSRPVLAAYGWRGVFAFGAMFPVLFGFLARGLIRGGLQPPAEIMPPVAVGALFRADLRWRTFALWPLFMLSFSSIILLALWMPVLLQQRGVSVVATSALVAWMNMGSLAVSLSVGWLLQRYGTLPTLLPLIAAAAIAWWTIALASTDIGTLTAGAILGGAAIGGETTALIGLAATIYPAEIRATGIGWATGFSRIGQMLIPPVVGAMVEAGWDPTSILKLCSTLMVAATLPLIGLSQAMARRGPGRQRSVPAQ